MAFGDKLSAELAKIAKQFEGHVEVGFLENATYPDGTPVAAVAWWNEVGASGPPRPFFRRMIEAEKSTWGPKLAAAIRHTGGDGEKALALVGLDIQGALIQSINDLTDPPLAQYTIDKKGFDKPLVDTSHMVNSTGSRVVK